MPESRHDEFYGLLYEQAQADKSAIEASAYYDRLKELGYEIYFEEAAAYALAGELFESDEDFDASILRVASLACLLSRTRHDHT